MYEGHFHLERRPFAATPDPGCCFLSPTLGPQFHNIASCAEQGRGIAILTGPAGIGKTLLSQVLLTELQSRFAGVYLGTGQFATRRAFLQAILYELGQPYGGMSDQELRLELSTALRNLISQKDGLLLVLDEAHLLSDRLLEEVRLLADLAQQGTPLVRVVLCGNPEFEERLTAPALTAFNQRVACHESIETLLRSESINYLAYRIQWAGGEIAELFEPGALQLIAEASDGVPRCLNQLADHSLSQTYLAGSRIVTEATVRESLTVLQSLPLRWNASALLSRSWNSKTQASNSAEALAYGEVSTPENAAVQNRFHEIADQAADSEGAESACFEFGAGVGSDLESTSANSALAIETLESTRNSAETSNNAAPISEKSVEIGVVTSISGSRGFAGNAEEAARSEELVTDFAEETVDFETREIQSEFEPESDDDMHRPEFSWLKHPAAHTEPVVETDAAQQGSGRSSTKFIAPLRFQVRSLVDVTDHLRPATEVTLNQDVSQQPEFGRDRRIECRTESSDRRAPVLNLSPRSIEEPAEEVVVDRYAALDAGLRPVSSPRISRVEKRHEPNPDLGVEQVVGSDAATPVVEHPNDPEIVTFVGNPEPHDKPDQSVKSWNAAEDFVSHPMDQIDSICALLEIAEESPGGGSGVELITDWGVERIDIDLSSDTDSAKIAEVDQPLRFNLQDCLGSSVVEIGRDLPQYASEVQPDRGDEKKSVEPPVDTPQELQSTFYHRATQYDVVIPEAAATSDAESESFHDTSALNSDREQSPGQLPDVAGAPRPPHTNFHNLFSTLRRRKLESELFLKG